MKRITDKEFIYVPSNKTDIKETFSRIRKEIETQKERERQNEIEAMRKTVALRRAR